MSGELEKLGRRWFEEVWNQGREETIYELFPPDTIAHSVGVEDVKGPDEFKLFWQIFRQAFADLRVDIDRAFDAGEHVTFLCRVSGVHRATGKGVEMRGTCVLHGDADRILESWNTFDFLGLLQQLDAIPAEALELALAAPQGS